VQGTLVTKISLILSRYLFSMYFMRAWSSCEDLGVTREISCPLQGFFGQRMKLADGVPSHCSGSCPIWVSECRESKEIGMVWGQGGYCWGAIGEARTQLIRGQEPQ
jgi:hypothetical protein